MKENLLKIMKNAYTPYSKFAVACIVKMKNNQEFVGVNVENASFKNGLCAEQVAIGSAISEGYSKKDFAALYVMGSGDNTSLPCFLCRELLVEFMDEDCPIICYNKKGNFKEFKVSDLCPHPFILEGEKHD